MTDHKKIDHKTLYVSSSELETLIRGVDGLHEGNTALSHYLKTMR